jgi:hypothetical protein
VRTLQRVAVAGAILLGASLGGAQEPTPSPSPPGESDEGQRGTTVTYGDDGLVVKSGNGDFKAQIRWRLQFRLSYPFDADPEDPEDFSETARLNLSIRRARFKLGGHAFRPWVEYYVEQQPAGPTLSRSRARLQWDVHF